MGIRLRKGLIAAGVLIAVFGLAVAFLFTPNTNRAAMIKKYGGPSPMFAEGAGGMRVHWRDQGCRDCPALILLHGPNASLHAWEPIVRRLGGEYRIITYDQPGHGLTGPHPRGDYSAAGMFEALNAVANAARNRSFLPRRQFHGRLGFMAVCARLSGTVSTD